MKKSLSRTCKKEAAPLQSVVNVKPKSLSGLEQVVMNIVWELKNCTVRDVLLELNQTKKLAYTTVATILQRLCDKGLVKKLGKSHTLIYTAKQSKELYSKNIVKSYLQKFIHSFGDTAIASFAKSIESLPKAKRAYFLKLLKLHDKNL